MSNYDELQSLNSVYKSAKREVKRKRQNLQKGITINVEAQTSNDQTLGLIPGTAIAQIIASPGAHIFIADIKLVGSDSLQDMRFQTVRLIRRGAMKRGQGHEWIAVGKFVLIEFTQQQVRAPLLKGNVQGYNIIKVYKDKDAKEVVKLVSATPDKPSTKVIYDEDSDDEEVDVEFA